MKVQNQLHEDNLSIYNGDCMEVVTGLPDNSIDLSVYSPPFAGLYNYSSDHRDMSNCESKEQFLQNYEYLVEQMARITKRGRINAVHCTDVFENACNLWDFPNEIIRIHERHGFQYRKRITVWKEPLQVRMRTMVKSLTHKLVIEDYTQIFTAMPDYVLIFTKKGANKVPVGHSEGFKRYFGEVPILPAFADAWNRQNGTDFDAKTLWRHLNAKYKTHDDPKTNKLSHYIWRRYASSVWDDVRIGNVLPYKEGREEDDEKHVHPLQLDVIDRIVSMYTNPGETVLTPFAGVGSEVYSPVSLGRKAIGIELKDSYYRQMFKNVEEASYRFHVAEQDSFF